MIDVESYFQAIKARWIHRIKMANPNYHNWVQIPKVIFRELETCSESLQFNFDKSVRFDFISNLPQFYKEVLLSYNLVMATSKQAFEETWNSQLIWGNKYITQTVRKKKYVLYFRNWMRSGIWKLGDIRFRNGILDENFIYTSVQDKRNIYMEIATLKKALLPYRNHIAACTLEAVNQVEQDQFVSMN